jgi:branched-chain amino acid transport system ATP-binding protein
MLEIQSLSAAYGDLPALREVSLKADAGKIVALIGPNGAGKTTLLRTIVGLHHPSAGAIFFAGTPIHTIPPHRIIEHGITLVPEGRRLFGGMTVMENLQVGAHSTRARASQAHTLKQVLEIFPVLGERRTSLARTLSGGMQQMLAIGRALMGVPRLLLLDEPSLGLAPLVVRNIFDVVTNINREGALVLLAEQNARAALELAHTAYILEQGRIVGHDTGAAMLKDEKVRRAYLGDLKVEKGTGKQGNQ